VTPSTTPAVPGRPRGLRTALIAAVRVEFRADVIDVDPADPVFGGPPCRVVGCARLARCNGMCQAHNGRWRAQGRPDLEQYIARTVPHVRGHGPLRPCRALGCRFGQRRAGLCLRHSWLWDRAGRPELGRWLAELPADEPMPAPPTCRISYCELWTRTRGATRGALCENHGRNWIERGRPELAGFIAGYEDLTPGHERLVLTGLPDQLKLEVQYALQCRHDEATTPTPPARVRNVALVLARAEVVSLLDWPEESWIERFPALGGGHRSSRGLIVYARRRVEELAHGGGWEREYPRDVWRLRLLGLHERGAAHLRFDRIDQPWLRALTKRWARWRLSTGVSATHVARSVNVVNRFARFLAEPHVGVEKLAEIDRALLERYLADLAADRYHRRSHAEYIGQLGELFRAIRQHRWDDTLPPTAMFFREDYPKGYSRGLPRALSEHVMAQLEHPGNLDRWPDPAGRLVTVILMRCGLRIGDALRLSFDCLVHDTDGAPYLRYTNHKMRREALVPIDEELQAAIAAQQRRVLARYPAGAPVLFPATRANPGGRRPLSSSTYRVALRGWLAACDVRDEHGRPAHLTPHQWRHTFGTRLINRDVPQEVVRVLLDHDSPQMTAHYARLHDKTVRRHWEQARKVNVKGETVTLDPDGPLGDAAWAKQRVGRATQALPNGYCGLPVQKTCPHANACLTCPMFITTPEFLSQHRAQRQQLLQLITAAQARGQARVVEMNQQVLGNLDQIIGALDLDPKPTGAGAFEQRVADAG
jgi:integrase